MSFSVAFAPFVDWWLIAGFAALAVVLLGFGAFRGARGLSARFAAIAALLLALANPILVQEERTGHPDIAAVVVDESPSQSVGERTAATAAALEELTAKIAAGRNLELRVIRAGAPAAGQASDGTNLFEAVRGAMADIPRQRLAGVVMLTDGQVHDAPKDAAALPFEAPLHVLLSGQKGERDRRITVVNAPRFGLVGKDVTIEIRIDDEQASGEPITVDVARDGKKLAPVNTTIGTDRAVSVTLDHAGTNIIEISVPAAPGEITTANNRTVLTVNGVRERLRVLLVSGEPHPGERVWRNLLKADPSVDLVHFTILRPPEKQDSTPVQELSLIAFPIRELFEVKLAEFDLIIFDRYRQRGVLPSIYLRNIAEYVRKGGAVLEAAGPAFATPFGLHRTALGELLPGAPTGRVILEGLKPRLTETGKRHPITSDLPGAQTESPEWGRWFRQIEVDNNGGEMLMTGPGERPLLLVARVGEGRVAQLLSDHIWLWARGLEGGGPHNEMLRRLAHWLMKEPDLEENDLRAVERGGQIVITRRSLEGDNPPVAVVSPSGKTQTLTLEAAKDGRAIGTVAASEPGVWRITDGRRTALAAVGALNPKEFADMRATPERLSAIAEASGGRIGWIADGIPDLRRVRAERTTAGGDWMGMVTRNNFTVTGVREVPLFPAITLLVFAVGALLLAWRREGH